MKKGFTLIELMAVIIVLAIVALIATPIVLNIVEDSRKSASQSSAMMVLDATNNYYSEKLFDRTFTGYDCTITNKSGCDELPIGGDKPDAAKISVTSNGEIYGSVTYGNYTYYYCNGKLGEEQCPSCELKEGTHLAIGSKYECDPGDGIKRNFYILSSNGNNYNLIMERNITDATDDVNLSYEDAKNYFTTGAGSSYTSSWTNVKSIQLPTLDEITAIVGNNKTNLYVGRDTFELLTIGSQYKWLYNYTVDCVRGGCDYELSEPDATRVYWTSTKCDNPIVTSSGATDSYWQVAYLGVMAPQIQADGGIRPVITVTSGVLYQNAE